MTKDDMPPKGLVTSCCVADPVSNTKRFGSFAVSITTNSSWMMHFCNDKTELKLERL